VLKRYSIERKWFKKGNNIEKQFWVYDLTENDHKYQASLSENWSDYVESFFPAQIAPFFFFDGEKIEALADFEKSGHLVHAAIHSLLGLNLVDQLDVDLVTLEKRKHKDVLAGNDQDIIDDLEKQLLDLSNRRDELKTEAGQLYNQKDSIADDLESLNAEYRQQGGDLFEKRLDLEQLQQSQQEKLAQQENILREIATGSSPLRLVKHFLVDIRNQAKIEENAHREQLLCEVLDDRDLKLIERISEQVTQKTILHDIELYLQEDRNNRRKSTNVEKYICLDSDGQRDLDILLENELPVLENSINETVGNIKKLREQIESTEISIGAIPDESKLSDIIAKRKELQENLVICENSLRITAEEIERTQRQYDQKNSELKRELTRVAHADFKQNDTKRLVTFSSKVRETLEIFRGKVIEKHIGDIETLVLDSFNSLIRKKTLVKKLKIDRGNYQVRLFNSVGDEIMPGRLSAGERQLLATALLWGICKAAGKPLPTIIDTPMGRLDTSHRTNLIDNYFPNASHQILLLSTNEEIVGKYHDKLVPYISRTCLLTHNESNGGTSVREGYFKQETERAH
jgi:DNA sulfur modification protein DndD